jgi:hypothetical protein
MRRSQLRPVKVVINRLGRLRRRTGKEKVASDVIALIFLLWEPRGEGHASSIVLVSQDGKVHANWARLRTESLALLL